MQCIAMPLLLVFFFILTGFISSEQKQNPSAKFYFDKAVHYKDKGNYPKAMENLKKLKQKFFYSSYNEKSLLLTADIYFEQKKFPSAVEAYEKHFLLYPWKQRDYVLYQIGMSYKKQLPRRAENDLSLAEPALEAFDKILKSKSSSAYKKKARLEKQNILNKKADRELKTALFFKSQGWNEAGWGRIQYFIKHYPKSPLMPKALFAGFQLAETLDKDSKTFKNRLIKNYPNSKEANSILQKKNSSFFSKWRQKLL